MPRSRLPNRRRSLTSTILWPVDSGALVDLSVGFDADILPREVFCRSRKTDSDVDYTADDAAVLVSLCLQSGYSLGEIAHSLGRTSDGKPASIIGALVEAAIGIDRELRVRLVANEARS